MPEVKITLRTIDEASKPARKVKEEFQSLAPGIEKAGKSITGFVSANATLLAGLAGTAIAIKKVYDIAKEGAGIEFAKERFDRLAESIGTTGDVLLDKMQVATKGTLSDMEAMRAATDLLSLGLAKTQEEAIRLATVQSGLAMDTNQLVLALTNQTTMRFDQLGVSVDGFQDKVNALKKSGLSASDAFKEAFLQQAEEQLKRVGNAADSAAGQYAIFEANIKNVTDALKEQVAQGLNPVIENTNKTTEVRKKLNQALEEGLLTEEQHEEILKLTARGYGDNSKALEILNSVIQDANPDLQELENSFYKVRDAVNAVSEDYGAQVKLINSMQSSEESFTERSKDLAEERAEAESKLQELRGQGYVEQSTQIQDQLSKIDEIKAKEAELAEERAKQSLQFVSNILAENLARDGWTENEFNAFAAQQEAWGLWSADVVEKSKAAWQDANKITDAINAIPTSKDVTIRIFSEPVAIGNASGSAYEQYKQGEKAYANGGSFIIPPSYGYEGFNMGGMATASGGETVTITPENSRDAFDYDKLARTIVTAWESR